MKLEFPFFKYCGCGNDFIIFDNRSLRSSSQCYFPLENKTVIRNLCDRHYGIGGDGILIVRERKHMWSSMPSKNLLIINIVTIIVFAILGIVGIFIPNLLTNQVLIILGITLIFMFILDFAKYYLFKKFNI